MFRILSKHAFTRTFSFCRLKLRWIEFPAFLKGFGEYLNIASVNNFQKEFSDLHLHPDFILRI